MHFVRIAAVLLFVVCPAVAAVAPCDAIVTTRVPSEPPYYGTSLFYRYVAGGTCYGYTYETRWWHESQPEPQFGNPPAIVFGPWRLDTGESETGIGGCGYAEGIWNIKLRSTCYRTDENGGCVAAPQAISPIAQFHVERKAEITQLEVGRAPDSHYPIEYGFRFYGVYRAGRGIKFRWLPTDTYSAGSSYFNANITINDYEASGLHQTSHGPHAEFLEASPTYCDRMLAPTIVSVPLADDECCDCNGNSMPGSCFGGPIRASTGNMRFTDRDPLPQIAGLTLERTYDTFRNWKAGWFGRGWHSVFDTWTREVNDGSFGNKTIVFATPDNGRFIFWGPANGTAFTQVWPRGDAPGALVYDPATDEYRLRRPRTSVELVYSRGGRVVRLRDVTTGREVRLTYTNGTPSRVEDSWGNWAWTITADPATHRINTIEVDGTTLGATYTYSSNLLMNVTLPGAVAWRRYTYSNGLLNAAYDAADALIESHTYAASGEATSSAGGGGADFPAVTHNAAGRTPKERATIATYATGATATYYMRQIAGRERTVEIAGGCSNCSGGARDAVYAYSARGELTREQDARGYITKREYDTSSRIVSSSGPWKPSGCDPATAADPCRLTHDTLSNPQLLFDSTPATTTTTYEYGDAAWREKATAIRTTSVLNPAQQRTETFVYDAVSGRTLVHSVSGYTGSPAALETRTTITTLNDGVAGAPFAPGGAFLAAWLTLPQPKGLVRTIDGPRTDAADVAQTVYYPIDASVPTLLRGRLAATRNTLGHIARYENYDVFGNAARIVDPNGVVTDSTFDTLGRTLTTTLRGIAGCDTTADPLCATDIVTSRTYQSTSGPLEVEQHSDGVTKYTYDSRGRVRTISRGPAVPDLREQIESVYSPTTGLKTAERILGFENGAWVVKTETSFTYDNEGRVTTTSRGTEQEQNSYGPGGVLAATRDARHSVFNTRYTYDPAGRLTSVRQLSNAASDAWIETSYNYDIAGNLIKVRDPNGNETTYLYDDFGQMLRQTSPVTGITTYTYDPARNLLSTTDANGNTTVRTYDAASRVLTATSSRPGVASEVVSWTYDQPGGGFAIGRLTTMNDPTGSTTYRYERRGLLIREEKTFSGTVSTPNTWMYTTTFEYDREGNRSKIGYPSGQVVTYTHDFAGRPLTAAPFVTGASYLPFGPRTQLVYGNGTVRTMQYDNHYRITKNRLTGPSGIIAEYDYAYEPGGNITGIADARDAGYSRTFGYDDLSRLVTADTGPSLWGTGGYSYDAMGNVLALTIGTPSTVGHRSVNFEYSGTTPKVQGVLENGVGRGVQSDAAGNETRYILDRAYSPRNLLASTDRSYSGVPAAAHRISYAYDGRGLRVARAEGNPGMSAALTTKRFYVYSPELQLLMMTSWDRPNPFKSSTWSNLIESELIWFGGAPVAQTSPSLPPPRYTFTDHLGTPLLQTDPAATITWRAEYEPFGNVYSLRAGLREDQPLRLPGQEVGITSEGSEENYNVFRWYRSGWGRYTTADPVGLRGGVNLFTYVANKPLTMVDRNGLCASGTCDCPGGTWVSTAVLAEGSAPPTPGLPFSAGWVVFAGVMLCTSNPYMNVPFVSLCGVVGPQTGAPHLRPNFGGAAMGCRGYRCREDLEGDEIELWAQVGAGFAFGSPSTSHGCWGLGVTVRPEEGISGGLLGCRTFIGQSTNWPRLERFFERFF